MIIADTHVHLYPVYDTDAALRGCARRLAALAPGTMTFACLAERHGCHAYRHLTELATADADFSDHPRYSILEKGRCIAFQPGNGLPPLFIIPGRQIATRERLEILCLGMDASISDHEPAELTIRRIRELDALPVLTWAVGKWLFKRKRVVMDLLNSFSPDQLLIGDSAMRPLFWPEPSPMKLARRRDYRLIAGSDPLPKAGDEKQAGRYATCLDAGLDLKQPARSFLKALRDASTPLSRVGSRCGVFEFIDRLR